MKIHSYSNICGSLAKALILIGTGCMSPSTQQEVQAEVDLLVMMVDVICIVLETLEWVINCLRWTLCLDKITICYPILSLPIQRQDITKKILLIIILLIMKTNQCHLETMSHIRLEEKLLVEVTISILVSNQLWETLCPCQIRTGIVLKIDQLNVAAALMTSLFALWNWN